MKPVDGQRVRLICPTCGYQIDRLREAPWGDGIQRLTIAPFVCAGCGEAMIINLVTFTLQTVPPLGWDVVKAHNPKLWAEIMALQQKGARDAAIDGEAKLMSDLIQPQEQSPQEESLGRAGIRWRRKTKNQVKSYFQLHNDLDRIVAAWALDTGFLFSQHTIMELMEWSARRTFGEVSPQTPASAEGDGLAGVPRGTPAASTEANAPTISPEVVL